MPNPNIPSLRPLFELNMEMIGNATDWLAMLSQASADCHWDSFLSF
jgi:hypothetical protein